jgi:hypothetical protein
MKWASTLASSPSGTTGCVQNEIWAHGTSSAKLCTYLALRLTLSPNGKKWDSTWPTSPRSSIGCVQNNFWAYGTYNANSVAILCQDNHYLWKGQNELPLEPRHLVVTLSASKMISEPMVCLAQTLHHTNTVSKWNEARFQMTHITKEFHQVHPKWFLNLWYVRSKPCTYLASRLAQSPNGRKRAFTWPWSPRSTIRCVQNDFWADGTFGTNCAPILHPY